MGDPTKYRTTIICSCAADYAVGYGETREQAQENAFAFYRRDHGNRKPLDVIDEVATRMPGGCEIYREA